MPSQILGRQKPSKLTIIALTVLMTIIGIYIVLSTHAASTTLYISPTGSDSGSCTSSAPCASVSYAYGKALAGDTTTIQVAAGTYGRQVVPSGNKSVIIQNASGTTPVFGTVTVNASGITLKGINIQRNDDPSNATLEALGSNNTFDGVNVDSKNARLKQGIYAAGAGNIFKNGSSFNISDEKAALVTGQNITIDNFKFYDAIYTGQPDSSGGLVHMECIYAIGADGLTIRNSRFWNCAVMDLMFTRGSWYNAPPWGNVLIENNVFEHSTLGTGQTPADWHYYGVDFNGAMNCSANADPQQGGQVCTDQTPAVLSNFVFKNNTFEQAVLLSNMSFKDNSQWIGNIGGGWSCVSGMAFSYNVGQKCGATDKAVSPASSTKTTAAPMGWVSPGAHDFHITSGSPAKDVAGYTGCTSTDKDGNARPSGLTCDAGAYEYGSTSGNPPPPPPPPTCTRAADINCDGSVNIQDVTVVLSNFGKPVAQSSDPRADSSGNGTVDIPDLTVVLSAFGS
jgi:hypothetical protein